MKTYADGKLDGLKEAAEICMVAARESNIEWRACEACRDLILSRPVAIDQRSEAAPMGVGHEASGSALPTSSQSSDHPNAAALADELEPYFTSGNSVPITRAVIPGNLAQRIVAALRGKSEGGRT